MWRLVIVSMVISCSAPRSLGYLQPPPSSRPHVGLGQLAGRLAVALEHGYRANVARAQPPVRLVPTDGSELALQALAADITIEGPIAHTELRFTFQNAEDRVREGRFSITLPASAAITRFAMKIDGAWREGRVVARAQGRQVYESYLQRNIDPALLEQDLGNVFSARVFPIGAREDKELVVAYDVPVASARGYTLALRGLPAVRQVSIVLDNNGAKRTFGQVNLAPEDVVVEVPRGNDAVAAGEAFVARIDTGTQTGDAPLEGVLYLVDTSASRAPIMATQTAVLEALLRAQHPDSRVAIAVFDQATVELYRGPAGRAIGILPRVLHHGALGSSNLGVALQRATTAGMPRVVIIGDGLATAGEHEVSKLSSIVRGSTIERVDAVQVGHDIDRVALQRIVRAGRKLGAIVDGNDPAAAVRQLATAIAAPVPITVDGATASWPPTTRHLAPGEPVFVFGLRAADGPLVVRVGDKAVTVTPRTGHARLRRVVARAELVDLVEQSQGARDAAKRALDETIEKLALAHGLVSPRTSLIVLETDADERFHFGPPETPAPRTDEPGISGRTQLENRYEVSVVNVPAATLGTGLDIVHVDRGESLCITTVDPPYPQTTPRVRADVMSPLALDVTAEAIRRSTFVFGGEDRVEWSPPKPKYHAPYLGTFHQVMAQVAAHDAYALETANDWHLANPGDLAAVIALGEALEAAGAGTLAARAYGSIADLSPNRAELLRVAAQRLSRISAAGARTLAIDFYQRALRERPDHATTYRLLAWALFRANRPEEALDVLARSLQFARRPSVERILSEDASIIAANIVARHPERRYAMPFPIAVTPTLRFTLSWETDANDVDLHVRDGKFGQFSAKRANGISDVLDGYGPEMFVVANPSAFPYELSAHYHTKGPMGLGLGTVQVIRHDGAGGVVVEDRPFVIQHDDALVELGTVTAR